MKSSFEINLPMIRVCNNLLQSDGEMSGYHHKFEIEKISSTEIQLKLQYSRRFKPEKMFRPRTRLRLINSGTDVTTVWIDSYPIIFWGFWGIFFSVLFILPVINTPQLPYIAIFIAFIIVGGWTVFSFNQVNGYFIYQILRQIFDNDQLSWLGHSTSNPATTHFLFNRITPFEIDSLQPPDIILQNLHEFPNCIDMGRLSKVEVSQKREHFVIFHYVKARYHYQLKHRVDIHITADNLVTIVKGEIMIEPILLSGATSAGIAGLGMTALIWMYLGLPLPFLLVLAFIALSTLFWSRDARKQQKKLLLQLTSIVKG